MSEQKKIEFSQMELGFEFPPSNYEMNADMVSTYCSAVEETSELFNSDVIPQTAAFAYAIAAMADAMVPAPGTIHVSQEIEFLNVIKVGDVLTSCAKVSRKQERGKLRILTVDINIHNQEGKAVLAGKTGFILPQSEQD